MKKYFGYESFRPGQEEIVKSLLSGRDVLAVMPTGAGKSICYQVPALLLPGVSIVISPLISLMQDQVKSLNDAGIHAGYINSSLSEAQIRKVYRLTREGRFQILYVAPERLETEAFRAFAEQTEISMVAVDEAHCISQWGQDFRPSYLKIVAFISQLPYRPVVGAFTATATGEVRKDIIDILRLNNPQITLTGFDRENLFYAVETTKQKDDYICRFIGQHPNDSGIIYCATRKNTDALYELLRSRGVPAARYHAGMDPAERRQAQEDFIYDRLPVIVATNAFGMGIDKSNVRYVLHYNMPQSIENYYQEAGRAGRDGEPAQCILLFSLQDVMINKFLLEKKDCTELSEEEEETVHRQDAARLTSMVRYCETTGCLRRFILQYFGEEMEEDCGSCGNCQREYEILDRTAEAKWVINCVAETRGRYGLTIVLGTLLGAKRARLTELGTVRYRSYGKLSCLKEPELRLLITQMLLDGYLVQTDSKYPVLQLGNIAPLRLEDAKVLIRKDVARKDETKAATSKKNAVKKSAAQKSTALLLTDEGHELFEMLRSLRLELARENKVPPYIIFNDKTLMDLCVQLPKTPDDMLLVSGVGEAKNQKYGPAFLEVLQSFCDAHPDAVTYMEKE